MNANESRTGELLLKEEVYAVVGCAMEVLNELGGGLREKTYERAMLRELELREIFTEQQREFPVFYKGLQIDTYIPDLIAFETLLIEIKTIEQITDREVGQVINYLKVSGLSVGIILNFKHPRLEWQRIVKQTPGASKQGSIRHFPDPELKKHSR